MLIFHFYSYRQHERRNNLLLGITWPLGILLGIVETAVPNSTSTFLERCLMRTHNDLVLDDPTRVLLITLGPVGCFSLAFVCFVYVKIVLSVRRQTNKNNTANNTGVHIHHGNGVVQPTNINMNVSATLKIRKVEEKLDETTATSQPSASKDSNAQLPGRMQNGCSLGIPKAPRMNSWCTNDTDVQTESTVQSKLLLPSYSSNHISESENTATTSTVEVWHTNVETTPDLKEGRRRKTTQKSLYVVVVFLLAWVPLPVMSIINRSIGKLYPVVGDIETFALCLMLSTRALHPILYAHFSRQFRDEFISTFRKIQRMLPTCVPKYPVK